MNRWKRVVLSLASAVLADVITSGVLLSIIGTPGMRFEQLFAFLYFSLFLVLIGWLIALPIVVLPEKVKSMRLWQMGLIGTAIGPAIMIGFVIYGTIVNGGRWNYDRGALTLVYLATGISFLSTVLYLSAVILFSRSSIQPTT